MVARIAHAGSPPRMRGKASSHFCTCSMFGITPAYAGKRTWYAVERHRSGDHPRVCGEKVEPRIFPSIVKGSPPRMRGKAWADYRMKPNRGITPAYAGKSKVCSHPIGFYRDHPRVCGEKHLCAQLEGPAPGSPPRMRGKVQPAAAGNPAERITPAYAGKSTRWRAGQTYTKDHPRVCGEKFPCNALLHDFTGITPAYAGKSLPAISV